MARSRLIIIWLNSTVLFLVAYLLVYLMTSFATAISASLFGIPTGLTYYETLFYIRSYDWTSDAVRTVFGTAPLVALLTGILLWIIYSHVIEETGMLKLLVAWMVAHCIVFFFGDMMMGAIFSRGFGYVIMYLYFMDTGKMIITLAALGAMFGLGLLAARPLLFTANTYLNVLRATYARQFVLVQYLLPFATGTIVIALIKIPGITLYELFLNGSMVVFLIPLYIRSGMLQDLYFDEEEKRARVYWFAFALSLVLLIGFRIGFGGVVRL